MVAPVHPVDDEMQPVVQLLTCQPFSEHPSRDPLGDPLAVGGMLIGAALLA